MCIDDARLNRMLELISIRQMKFKTVTRLIEEKVKRLVMQM